MTVAVALADGETVWMGADGRSTRDDDECVIVAARATTDFVAVGLFERIPRGMVQRVVRLQPKKATPSKRPKNA